MSVQWQLLYARIGLLIEFNWTQSGSGAAADRVIMKNKSLLIELMGSGHFVDVCSTRRAHLRAPNERGRE